MSDYTHTLVATLGGQPQIVTFTLDLLLKNFPISEVIVIHPEPSSERLQHSLSCLYEEFAGDYYAAISALEILCNWKEDSFVPNSFSGRDKR